MQVLQSVLEFSWERVRKFLSFHSKSLAVVFGIVEIRLHLPLSIWPHGNLVTMIPVYKVFLERQTKAEKRHLQIT